MSPPELEGSVLRNLFLMKFLPHCFGHLFSFDVIFVSFVLLYFFVSLLILSGGRVVFCFA